MFLPLGGGIKSFLTLFIDPHTPLWTGYFMIIGSTAYRFTAISMITERLFATYFAENYETHPKFKFFGIFINIFSVFFVFGFSSVHLFLKLPPITGYAIVISMSVVGVFVSFWRPECTVESKMINGFQFSLFIVKKNLSLRRATRDNPKLQQRYQVGYFSQILVSVFLTGYQSLKLSCQ